MFSIAFIVYECFGIGNHCIPIYYYKINQANFIYCGFSLEGRGIQFNSIILSFKINYTYTTLKNLFYREVIDNLIPQAYFNKYYNNEFDNHDS